jgi:hypothetical protein
MADLDIKKLFFCQVMSGNPFQPLNIQSPGSNVSTDFNVQETIYFYVTTNVNFRNTQSVNVKIAPYTSTGKTQNMGRKEISFTANMMLLDDNTSTKDDKLNSMFRAKAEGRILAITMPGLPLSSNYYYINDLNWDIKEPNRIMATVSFIEVLESNLQVNTQDLVLANAGTNLNNLLKALGLV